jgi:serine protease Do
MTAGPPSGAGGVGGGVLTQPLRPGDALEYLRTDKLTGARSTVVYRVDRVVGDEVVFNGGGKVERADGQVVAVTSPAGGLFDLASPPGGWARANLLPGMRWQADYTPEFGERQRHELIATVGPEQSMQVDGVELQVLRIGYEGWIYASSASAPLFGATSRFQAAAWYSPELHRVVRFEGAYQRGMSSLNESPRARPHPALKTGEIGQSADSSYNRGLRSVFVAPRRSLPIRPAERGSPT